MDIPESLAPDTLPIRCQRRVLPGDMLNRSCQDCGHSMSLHPGRRSHPTSSCLHCVAEWIAVLLGNVATVVDPSD